MNSSVEALEGNKVKVIVEVSESEFDKDLDRAFRALAKEVRLPGFRPGKAPRKVLEARIGSGYAREQAFNDGLPNYYSEACKENDVDVIAPPDIEILEGEESGAVKFAATVEVRPSITVSGYEGLEIEVPNPNVSDDDVEVAVQQFLARFSELVDVDRPGQIGDRATVNIEGSYDGEPLPGLTAEGYIYEIGTKAVVPEIDEHLEGASAGDELDFSAEHPDEDEDGDLEFHISVVKVQESVIPEADDEIFSKNSEFDTEAEFRADRVAKMTEAQRAQAQAARRNGIAEQVAALVADDDLPVALVELEVENRAQDFTMRLQGQGLDLDQYLQFSGQSREDVVGQMREMADTSARLDLALRAIAEAEGLEVTEDDLTAEFERIAPEMKATADQVRERFADAGQLSTVRSDLAKSKALDWLEAHSTMVDEEGNAVDPADLIDPDPKSDDGDEA